MKFYLIADAGSTKTDWVLLDSEGNQVLVVNQSGLNALMADDGLLKERFVELRRHIGDADISHIYYYGAGCASPEICRRVEDALLMHLGAESATAASDLLGAARGLLGDKPGIACILGTGSNSCLYNGNEIERNIPSLGFILGDEGSGAALGKRLVSDIFKERLPLSVREKFFNEFSLTLPDVLERVYRGPAPNRFLASLVPFLHRNLWNPYVYSMVQREFSRFFRRNVSLYKGGRSLPVYFTGGVANAFSDVLRETAERKGFSIGGISDSPLQGIIGYHAGHIKQ